MGFSLLHRQYKKAASRAALNCVEIPSLGYGRDGLKRALRRFFTPSGLAALGPNCCADGRTGGCSSSSLTANIKKPPRGRFLIMWGIPGLGYGMDCKSAQALLHPFGARCARSQLLRSWSNRRVLFILPHRHIKKPPQGRFVFM